MTPSEAEKEEFLIENTYPVSSKDLREALSRRAWVSPGIIVPATLAVLLISYGSTYAAVTSQYNVVIMVVLLGGLFFYWFVNRFYVVRLNVKQNMLRYEEEGIAFLTVGLNNQEILLKPGTADGRKCCFRIPFWRVKKILKTKNLVVVCTDAGRMVIFKNEGYTVGSRKALLHLLKESCPQLRFRRGFLKK